MEATDNQKVCYRHSKEIMFFFGGEVERKSLNVKVKTPNSFFVVPILVPSFGSIGMMVTGWMILIGAKICFEARFLCFLACR